MNRLQRLVAELRRRRVFRALVAWGIGSFAVIQVIEPVLHAYHLPDWPLTLVVTLLGAGFPLTAALAWVFDVGPAGITRTSADAAVGAVDAPLSGRGATALVVGVGLLAAAPGLVWYLAWPGTRQPAVPSAAARATAGPPSIAVLPFADMSPGHDQEYLADGVAEEILNALSGLDGLRVAGRTSSFWFKGRATDPDEIGRKLGVGSFLEGSVRKDGNRVRITAELVSVADGYRIWSETFDRELTDIFRVQDEIARAVVAGLHPRLVAAAGSGPRGAKPTRWEAYSQYLLGRRLLARGSWVSFNDEASIRDARIAFERAVSLDPRYAPAHAGLAEALGDLAGDVATTPEEVTGYATLELAAAQRAIDLDPGLADGYLARGYHRLGYAWDWKGGLADMDRATALRGGDARIAIGRSRALLAFNRRSEAVEVARRATELDPLSAPAWAELSHALMVSGAMPASEAAARRCEAVAPGSCAVLVAWALMDQGKLEEAVELLRGGNGGSHLQGLAIAYHRMGREKESQAALDELVRRMAPVSAYQIAEVHAYRDEPDAVFEWLERARIQHDEGLEHVGHNSAFRALAGDPRWTAFLARMGLPGE